jgi:hypothetical protein
VIKCLVLVVIMDVLSTYRVFLVKTLKEKKYYWTRNAFFLIFPLLFTIIFLFSDTSSTGTVTNGSQSRTYPPLNEVCKHPLVCINLSRSIASSLSLVLVLARYRKSSSKTYLQPSTIVFTLFQMTRFTHSSWRDLG